MIPRAAILGLVATAVVLLVAQAVLIGGYALASAAQDAVGAKALWWVAMSLLLLLVIDVLLLVGAIALRDLDRHDDS